MLTIQLPDLHQEHHEVKEGWYLVDVLARFVDILLSLDDVGPCEPFAQEVVSDVSDVERFNLGVLGSDEEAGVSWKENVLNRYLFLVSLLQVSV